MTIRVSATINGRKNIDSKGCPDLDSAMVNLGVKLNRLDGVHRVRLTVGRLDGDTYLLAPDLFGPLEEASESLRMRLPPGVTVEVSQHGLM